jgi:hypothetical protein
MAQLSSTFLTHETPGTQGEHTRFSKGLEPRCRHSVSNDAAQDHYLAHDRIDRRAAHKASSIDQFSG